MDTHRLKSPTTTHIMEQKQLQDTTKSFITTAGQNQSTSDDTISQNVSNEIPSYRGKSRMCVRNLKMSFAICIWNLGIRVTQ